MDSKIKIGLVQINNSFSGQNYFPYSVGILQAYAKAHLNDFTRYEFLLPIYLRTSVEDCVKKLEGADFLFFSSYVWNMQMSLAVAEAVKRKDPRSVVVFGGPQIPDRIDGFLEKYAFIDVVCHGEGEQIFYKLLECGSDSIRQKELEKIPSISFLDKSGKCRTHPKSSRINDLREIPSPYLSGVFEPLIQSNPQEKWIAMWETNRGCPFACAFCDWGSATQSRVFQFDLERIFKEIDWFADHQVEFIFCADANFGMLPRDYEIVSYMAEVKKKTGFPCGLSVQNTKNATERAYKIQKLLSDSGLNKGVTLSFQSVDPTTLNNVKRDNISTASYQELQRRFTRDGVDTYTDIILGLPGETYQSFCEGVASIVENGQHNRIQFNNLSILPNAAMGDPTYQREHGMVTVESAIVNMHGSLEATHNEIFETQQLVIATKTCPKEDWVRVRSFSWMVGLIYFNKILQIPLLLLHKNFHIGFQDLFSIFADGDLKGCAIFNRIRDFFRQESLNIQSGGPEYSPSKKWLNIWWPAHELVFIDLCAEGKLEALYNEAEILLGRYLKEKEIDIPPKFLNETTRLNQALVKLPFQTEDLNIQLTSNIWETYQAARKDEHLALEEKQHVYRVDRTSERWTSWEAWCREVIWWGNKKGAYLYGNVSSGPQLAGHY